MREGEGRRAVDRRRFLQEAGAAGVALGALAWAAPESITVSPAATATGTAAPYVPGPTVIQSNSIGSGPSVARPTGPGGSPGKGGPGGGGPGGGEEPEVIGPAVLGESVAQGAPPAGVGAGETPRGGLAFTGLNLKRMLDAGAALVVMGSGLLAAAGRRRAHTDQADGGTNRPPAGPRPAG